MNHPELSYWEKEVWLSNIDVLIVGSGIVGLNAARALKEHNPELQVVIFERGALPAGASTRNAGFACFGSMTELLADVEQMGEQVTFDLVAKRYEGLQRMREKLGDTNIAYHEWGGYELFPAAATDRFHACREAMDYFNRQLQAVTGLAQTYAEISPERIASFGFAGVNQVIVNRAEGQIHTGKMMNRLEQLVRGQGVKLINGVSVVQLENHSDCVQIKTGQGWVITARQVIVATNGFARQLLPDLPVQPARNQVLITAPLEDLPFKGCFHYDEGYYYFRNINNRILLGGGRNVDKAGETTDQFGTHVRIREKLEDLLRTLILPDRSVAIESWWTGIMGVGVGKRPIIRKVSPRVTVAVRLGGMGVAIGSWVGEEVARTCLS